MPHDPIPLTVLGGYLGAGKTTIINSLLRRTGARRLGVLVNDFGEVNIDAQILRARSDGIVELAGGCVCCDLSLGMGPALAQLLALNPPPDQVVVEVSGVGEPASVAAWARTPGFRPDGVAVVVALDRVRELAADRWVGDLIVNQLGQADILLCSRGDLLSHSERAEVAKWLADRSSAPQVAATRGEVPEEVLFGLDTQETAARSEITVPDSIGANSTDAAHADDDLTRHPLVAGATPAHGMDARAFVYATAWATEDAVDQDALVDALSTLPGLLRAKGFARSEPEGTWLLVQAIGHHVECSAWKPEEGASLPTRSVLTVLTTPDVKDATIAAALPEWHPLPST